MTELVERIADPSVDKLLATLIKEALTMELVEAIEAPRLTKDAFTIVLVADAAEDSADKSLDTFRKEVFSWARLDPRLRKEALTIVLVADADEDSVDKLLATFVKDAFTMELVDAMDVFTWDTLFTRLAKEAFTDALS